MNKLLKINTKVRWHSQWNGDSALTLFFNEEASETLTRYILSLVEILKSTFSEKLIEAIPAYNSLTLCFDVLAIDTKTVEALLKEIIEKSISASKETTVFPLMETIKIPVCYEKAYAPDLESLAAYCKLSTDEVIQRHTQVTYLVNMLGFLPGFLYLSGLVDALHCPRKETPSLKISAGAVGIGGNQTGVYPVDSPGGWHIIGQTPISIFSPTAKHAFIAQPLNKICFIPIDSATFKQLKNEQV